MPPNLDVYVLSNFRNRKTVEKFLDLYVDRAGSEHRDGEQLMILPLGVGVGEMDVRPIAEWDWEPAGELTWILDRGLQTPYRAFTVSLRARNHEFSGATLSFAPDGRVFFGLSIDDEGAVPHNLERAKALLAQMAEEFHGVAGYVGVEQPPPWQFRESPFWLYRWHANSADNEMQAGNS